jgi:hypothetical protein
MIDHQRRPIAQTIEHRLQPLSGSRWAVRLDRGGYPLSSRDQGISGTKVRPGLDALRLIPDTGLRVPTSPGGDLNA